MRIDGIVKPLPRIEIREISPPEWLKPKGSAEETPRADFGKMLSEVLRQVSNAQYTASELAQRFARGEPVDEPTLVMAMERANLAFQLTLQVRNRVLEAYQEVMRLQI